jgi:LPS-assembly protein
MNCFFKFALILYSIHCASISLAQIAPSRVQGLVLNAESMYRDSNSNTIELEGAIQLIFKGQHLSAEKAHINLSEKIISAEGNVRLVTQQATVGAQKITINYETNQGTIYEGYVESGPVIFQGKVINKTGESDYLATEAEYTACTTCPPGWAFSGSTIKAELGGYAYIKHAFLKFGGIPLLWLPYLIVPLKSDRQSGLLIPSIDFSESGGFAVSQSFFWAISRSSDATLTLKNYEFRGLKGLANYRYVLSESSQGELDFGLLQDRVFASDSRLNEFRPSDAKSTPINRWFLRYSHYYDLPNDYVQRSQLNLASDLQYPRDFPGETKNHGDAAMENRFSLSQRSEKSIALIDSSYFVNLLQSNPLAGNNNSVHRLPEIQYSKTQTAIGNSGFLYALDLSYVNFARGSFAYDDISETSNPDGSKNRFVANDQDSPNCEKSASCIPTRDGTYDASKDIIRTGQRFDFRPSIHRPFLLGGFVDVDPKISYRETHYNFSVGDDRINVRRFMRAEVAARTTLSQIYNQDGPIGSSRYKHELQPEIIATQIPWFDQKSHPFFGNKSETPFFSRENISDSDLLSNYGIQFDYNDRIYDRNLMTLALNNKITEKRWLNGQPTYRQLATWKVAQSYDAYQKSKGNDPWSDISSVLDLRLDRFQSYTLLNYFPYKKITNTSSRVRINDDSGNYFQVALVRNFAISPSAPVDYSARTEDYTFSGGTTARYLNLLGQVVYDANWDNSVAKRKIKSWAYIAQIKPPGDCWSIYFIHDQVTGGDTNFRLNFEFIFDGQQKSGVTSNMLDSFGF